MTTPRYKPRQIVRHKRIANVDLEVVFAAPHEGQLGREPTYELRAAAPPHTIYDDVEESDIAPVVVEVSLGPETRSQEPGADPSASRSSVSLGPEARSQEPGADPSASRSGPGWLYDAHSGFELGPASYEQRAEFEAHVRTTAKTHMTFHNLAGCKRDVLLEPARRALPRPQPPRARRA